MQRAKLVPNVAILCPACRFGDFLTYRREPAGRVGHILNRCTCRRCGTHFRFEEDKIGRPVA